ncbi:MAG: alanine racemase [Propionibacteriaceae bacterium]|jgi:predicted amino acid racemase|nr:alanine racemase [Propionibacteriaceae bacterium]
MGARLTINTEAILHNLRIIQRLVDSHGVTISVVTKALLGHEELMKMWVEAGVASICESRLPILEKWSGIDVEKWLIRSPVPGEADQAVRCADITLVSEGEILESLSQAAVAMGCIHKVVIMVELGELREGCMPEELLDLCELAVGLPGLDLHGIGTNLSDFNEVVPNDDNRAALIAAADHVERTLGVTLEVISGGNSSSLVSLIQGKHPSRINHLRIGEAILLGTLACFVDPFEGARLDAFTVDAPIFEVKDKPSMPWGERSPRGVPIVDDPTLVDRGVRRRALVALGKQDMRAEYLVPCDPSLIIYGDTSDCLIVDVTDSKRDYHLGDIVRFRPKYQALVSAMNSPYVDKIVLRGD